MIANNAVLIRVIGLVVGCLWVVVMSFTLPMEVGVVEAFSWHGFLIATDDPMYPFNIHVLMWICFFFCLAEVAIKWLTQLEERRWLDSFSLYHSPNSVVVRTSAGEVRVDLDPDEALKPELLAAIYNAKRKLMDPSTMIAAFMKKINYQFQSSNDVSDVYSAVTSGIELRLHQIDLSYTVIRYLVWLIPTLGFMGTVIGVARALGQAGIMESGDPTMLAVVIPMLGSAFYTTLLALLLSSIVMILIQIAQANDEKLVNRVGTYCMDEIVTNLKSKSNN